MSYVSRGFRKLMQHNKLLIYCCYEPNYTRLTLQEGFKIEKYLDQKLSISSIAILLNRNKSTTSREVKKFKKRYYDAFISHQIAFKISMNKNYGRRKILSIKKLLKIVHSKLKKRWCLNKFPYF
uniref:helix-turn-helix domain-containing protein n=2 Tax=Empedobacter stercoris TaxID=1628248 RepID=UPI003744AF6A